MAIRLLFTLMGFLSFLFGGCKQPSSPSSVPGPDGPVLKVAVFADGRLTVEGAPATIPSLQSSLRTLCGRQGVVWYYREAGQQEPPPMATEVIEAVVEARLPIRLSSRPDYSDSIDFDGSPMTE